MALSFIDVELGSGNIGYRGYCLDRVATVGGFGCCLALAASWVALAGRGSADLMVPDVSESDTLSVLVGEN